MNEVKQTEIEKIDEFMTEFTAIIGQPKYNLFKRFIRWIRNEDKVETLQKRFDIFMGVINENFAKYDEEIDELWDKFNGSKLGLQDKICELEQTLALWSKNSSELRETDISFLKDLIQVKFDTAKKEIDELWKRLDEKGKDENEAYQQIISELKGIKDLFKPFEKELEKMKARIGKNELMHVEVHKSANDTYSKAMSAIVNQSTEFAKYMVKFVDDKLPIDHSEDQIIEPNKSEEKKVKKIFINEVECGWKKDKIEYNDIIMLTPDALSNEEYHVSYRYQDMPDGEYLFLDTITKITVEDRMVFSVVSAL